MFTVRTRASDSLARTGTLHLAHGEVRTPAFVPLATKGAVKTLEPRDVAALGYELILGNTFHLFLAPGPELVDAARRAATSSCAGSGRSSPTPAAFRCSRWATASVADEIKGRGYAVASAAHARARSSRSRRRACAFAPTSTAASGSSARRARWRSRRRWTPTSRWCSTSARRSTSPATTRRARPSAPTAGSSAACAGTPSTGPTTGRLRDRPGRRRARPAARVGRARSPRARCDGIAIGGSLGRDKAQMYEVVSWATGRARAARARAPAPPARDRRRRRPDRRRRAAGSTRSTARCRRGWAATASRSCPTPRRRWRVDLAKVGWRDLAEPILDGCPCPACAARLLARLPALPAAGRRADRAAAA